MKRCSSLISVESHSDYRKRDPVNIPRLHCAIVRCSGDILCTMSYISTHIHSQIYIFVHLQTGINARDLDVVVTENSG